jgi:ABC-type multidrug transport system ATPase subunit/pSer/pThr/pTyr-binding forkhead associated (FHA) protein
MQREINVNSRPYLQGLVGQLAGKQFYLEDKRVVVGRDPSECQLVLAQAVVSKMQAALEVDDVQRVTLVDLSGKQSTFVNGQAIVRRELEDGDRVGFGLGGVVAFTFRAAFPSVKYRNSPDNERPVARLVISTEPEAKPAPPAPPVAVNAGTTIIRAAPLREIRLGRAPDNNFVLDAPSVSRYHAMLSYENGAQPILTDLNSTNGTFVNGQPLTEPRQLTPEDLIFLGGFLLHVDGRTIKQHDLSASSITARHISKTIDNKTILQDISLAIKPREFVGLMGPSGCGKSTLMDALNGLRPATGGNVFINDLDLYQNFNAVRRSIGYVPQRDILHDALTVERPLFYAAKLRLPDGTSAAAVNSVIDEVIQTVGLVEQRHTAFRQLSGGQQKRLSLALELITKPSFLFLDEPTSPLDPETTENMMMLFRRLADEGRIVVMVTHKFEKFREMHQIAMLTKGGRLAFFGPPAEALQYFKCQEPGDIYRYIGARDPDQLSRDFEKSTQHHQYVQSRIVENETRSKTAEALQLETTRYEGPERNFGLTQWLTLTHRYLEVKLKDKRNTLLLLAQAPIVAILLAIIVGDSPNNSQTLFIASIVSIWFGANNAVREIVAEAAIYSRERLVNLKIPSYVFSKFTVLSGIALVQCLLFVGILVGMNRLKVGDFASLTLILYLTSLAGITTGLFFSALVNSTEKAMSVLPLILIPQLLLSGYLKPLNDVYVFGQSQKPASHAQFLDYVANKEKSPPKEPVVKRDGLGVANYAAYLMVARWTIEGLAHAVSIDDQDARSKLAGTIHVTEYERILEGKPEREVTAAYRQRVAVDGAALALFNLIFLALTMWVLKRKDVL